jgi:hypothetical protein
VLIPVIAAGVNVDGVVVCVVLDVAIQVIYGADGADVIYEADNSGPRRAGVRSRFANDRRAYPHTEALLPTGFEHPRRD